MAGRSMTQEMVETTIAQIPNTNDTGISYLIGGLLVFGLAAGGLVIGYASTAIQWAITGALATTGLMLTVSGIWTLIKRQNG